MKIENIEELKELVEMCTKPVLIEKPIDNYMAKIWYFIGAGEKINAVKELRNNTDKDLKQCKVMIEGMMDAAVSFRVRM